MCYLFNGLDVDLSGLSHRLIQHCVFSSVCFQCVCVFAAAWMYVQCLIEALCGLCIRIKVTFVRIKR